MDQEVKRIAVYLPATAEYSRRLALGVRKYCEQRDGLVWRDFWYAPEMGFLDASRGPTPWSNWEPDGLIAHACPAEVDMQWLTTGVGAVVATTSDCTPEQMPVVYIDRQSVARLALRHFLHLGLEHLAFVGAAGYGGSTLGCTLFAAEVAGLGKRLLHYDLLVNPGEGLDYLQDRAGAEPGLLEFLRTAPKPLGVLTHSDSIARAVCDACLAIGLAVPADVAVVGLGNTILAESSAPSLSSIHPPGEEVGFQAMALLDKLLHGGERPRKPVLVPATELVVRQSSAGRQRQNPDIQRALRLVRERACQGMRVADLARLLSVSRSYLEHEFARLVGHTPGEEIRRVRLNRAKELLETSDRAITEIAALVGFERIANFSEFFRKHTGMSPRAYRQAKRKPGAD